MWHHVYHILLVKASHRISPGPRGVGGAAKTVQRTVGGIFANVLEIYQSIFWSSKKAGIPALLSLTGSFSSLESLISDLCTSEGREEFITMTHMGNVAVQRTV